MNYKNRLVEGQDYLIENGLYVFTKEFHLKRGSCCKNGCKNCPYGFDKKKNKKDKKDKKKKK
jgi:hypothetical protein